ncbi:hypothetical protein TNCV_2670991 [Trichonephila clavipes]|nr:hypothetical protein TNCV_2670991 [Trichonephila clavipes]
MFGCVLGYENGRLPPVEKLLYAPIPSVVGVAFYRRFLLGVWTVNSPQSHIVRVYDAGHGKSGVFHSAEWHDGDWSGDGIREAWLWFFIWVESF